MLSWFCARFCMDFIKEWQNSLNQLRSQDELISARGFFPFGSQISNDNKQHKITETEQKLDEKFSSMKLTYQDENFISKIN